MRKVFCWLLLATAMGSAAAHPQQPLFDVTMTDYVPEGQPHIRRSLDTADKCQAACGKDENCKAFSFRTRKPLCYFYAEVYMGGSEGTRQNGLLGGGVSIVRKQGFVSAFKETSFPPGPTMLPALK